MKHRTRDYQPSLESFFPGLRRGHSLGTHLRGKAIYADGTLVGKHQPVCTAERCGQKGQPHKDRSGNIKDWEEERGVNFGDLHLRRQYALVRHTVMGQFAQAAQESRRKLAA